MSCKTEEAGLGLAYHKCSWLATEESPPEVLATIGEGIPRKAAMQLLGSRVADTHAADSSTSFRFGQA